MRPGRLRRVACGIMVVIVGALLTLILKSARIAHAEQPTLDGTWVVAEIKPAHLWFAESIEIEGSSFTTSIHGFGRYCRPLSSSALDQRVDETLICKGTMIAVRGTLARHPAGGSAKAVTAIIEPVEFDFVRDKQAEAIQALASGRPGWIAERSGSTLVVHSAGEARVFLRMAKGQPYHTARAVGAFNHAATVQAIEVALMTKRPLENVRPTDSLRWRCVAREVSKGSPLGADFIAFGKMMDGVAPLSWLQDGYRMERDMSKVDEISALMRLKDNLVDQIKKGHNVPDSEIFRATRGLVDPQSFSRAALLIGVLYGEPMGGGKPVNSVVCTE